MRVSCVSVHVPVRPLRRLLVGLPRRVFVATGMAVTVRMHPAIVPVPGPRFRLSARLLGTLTRTLRESIDAPRRRCEYQESLARSPIFGALVP